LEPALAGILIGAPRTVGGSAHSPRRKCAEPRQCAGQVSWLGSMMATKGDSENMRGCNTVEFTLAYGCELSRRGVC
jgi:hypothetical protein